jgi:hypothetical protein
MGELWMGIVDEEPEIPRGHRQREPSGRGAGIRLCSSSTKVYKPTGVEFRRSATAGGIPVALSAAAAARARTGTATQRPTGKREEPHEPACSSSSPPAHRDCGENTGCRTEQGFDFEERCVAGQRPGVATTKSPCSRSAKRRAFTDRPSRSVQPIGSLRAMTSVNSDWLKCRNCCHKDRSQARPSGATAGTEVHEGNGWSTKL